MSEIVPQHSHCQVCGKTIPISETLCSEECKNKFHSMLKKRKLLIWAMYAIIGIIFVIFIFSQ
jgi:predicted nucleic acid-binding Zn ribbon protein